MKSKAIGIVSGLSIIALFILAFLWISSARRGLAIMAIAISLVPMYFLYATSVLGKYKSAGKTQTASVRASKSTAAERKRYNDRHSINKAANDYGKVLDFPKDGSRKSNKK